MRRATHLVPALSIALALTAAGCAERQAQVAVQSSLNVVATGLVAADEAVAGTIEEAAAVARSQVISEGGDLARYDSLMARWTEAVDVLRSVRAALVLTQGAVTVWIETGNLPEEYAGLCEGLGQAVEGLVALLDTLHVEVPEAVTTLTQHTAAACRLAAPWFQPSR